MRRTDRSDDELHLIWLQMRQAGYRIITIAARFGVKPERVRVVIGRVRNDYAKSAGGDDIFGGKYVK